jgi:hypothetical protein
MDVNIYTGNGSSQSITNNGSMKPDLVWVKSRSSTTFHGIYDAVRGVSKRLWANDTAAEADFSPYGVTAFNSNGFTVNDLTSSGYGVNENTVTYVGWQWRAAGSTVSNTAGTITSTVSANTTAGFSIVTYTGTGSNATIGHGLGAVPGMIIAKRRSATQNWGVAHRSLSGTQTLYLDLTQAVATGVWNGTPTSTVFNITTDGVVNASGSTYVAYCFAPVAGYSAFSSYTGNGSADGPFVYTGFRPRYVLIKCSSATADWVVFDALRNGYNIDNKILFPNGSFAESAGGVTIDILSNGFKVRATNAEFNSNTATYIYATFAESPFQFANAR